MIRHCPVYQQCGACSLIHTDYTQQLKDKKAYIQKLFPKRKVEDVVGMKDPYHYRHKVYASFSHTKDGTIKAGMYEENSHKVVNTSMCLIQHVKANAIIQDICKIATDMHIESYDEDTHRGVLRHVYIRISHANGKALVVIVIGSKNLPGSNVFVKRLLGLHPEIQSIVLNHNHENTSLIVSDINHVIYGKGYIEDSISATSFRISTNTFFQVNPVQTEKIYKIALDMADLNQNDTVLDMCCGIGTISLLAAKHCSFVLGVEINEKSIRDAIANAKRNAISNVRFIAGDCEKFLAQLYDSPTAVFLDPPRNGFSHRFMKDLDHLQAKKIIYISCNPQTQARDIRYMKNYRIERIVPVDNFAFTKHVENVVLLSKR